MPARGMQRPAAGPVDRDVQPKVLYLRILPALHDRLRDAAAMATIREKRRVSVNEWCTRKLQSACQNECSEPKPYI